MRANSAGRSYRFGAVLKAAVLAGLVAGAAGGLFHFLVTEPVIERAIQIEEQLNNTRAKAAPGGTRPQTTGDSVEEPVVSRETQRVGLIFGLVLYGGAWGLLLGVLFYLTGSWLSDWNEVTRAVVFAALAGWSVAVFPLLKYPANPPGVGEAETIAYRQTLYLGFVGLSLLGMLLTLRLRVLIGRTKLPAWPVVSAVYLIYLAALYLVMPSNPDPVRLPAPLVREFRAFSLAGLILFCGVLAASFGWFWGRRESSEPARR